VLWFGEGQKYQFLSCLQFVLYLKQFYKSNTGQLELFCPVLHFLANQTHQEKNSEENEMKKKEKSGQKKRKIKRKSEDLIWSFDNFLSIRFKC